jgi:hypothetical protein
MNLSTKILLIGSSNKIVRMFGISVLVSLKKLVLFAEF